MTSADFGEDHVRAHIRGSMRAILGGHVKASRLRISVTRRVVHYIFTGDSATARGMREKFPLTATKTETVTNPTDPDDTAEVEVTEDLSEEIVPWDLDLKKGKP